jgi:hypothetical protein
MPALSGADAQDQWPRAPSRGNFDHEHFGARGSQWNLTPGSAPSHAGAADIGFWSWQVKRSKSRGVSRFVPPGAARLHLPSCTAFARSTAPRGELGRGSPKPYGENRCQPPGRESVRGVLTPAKAERSKSRKAGSQEPIFDVLTPLPSRASGEVRGAQAHGSTGCRSWKRRTRNGPDDGETPRGSRTQREGNFPWRPNDEAVRRLVNCWSA